VTPTSFSRDMNDLFPGETGKILHGRIFQYDNFFGNGWMKRKEEKNSVGRTRKKLTVPEVQKWQKISGRMAYEASEGLLHQSGA
jgi:hypothetical protein